MPIQNRWIHCDSCENAYDKPLTYEKGGVISNFIFCSRNAGWGKRQTYVFSVCLTHIQDVTPRYTLFDAKALKADRQSNPTAPKLAQRFIVQLVAVSFAFCSLIISFYVLEVLL